MRKLLQEFLSVCKSERGLSFSTLRSYDGAGRLWMAWFQSTHGRVPALSDWTEPSARAWVAHERNRQIRQTTLRHRVAALRSLGDWLLHQKRTEANPWTGIRTPVNEELRQPCASAETVRALFDACDRMPNKVRGLKIKAALALMALAGLRESEVFAVRLEDVNTQAQQPSVFIRSGKGKKAGRVPLSRMACQILAAWIAVRPQTKVPWLLYQRGIRHGDRQCTVSNIASALEMLKKLALVEHEDITAHSLRRFGATSIAQQAGASVADAQRFLRHSDPAVTLRYLKPTNNLHTLVDGIMDAPAPKPAEKPAEAPRRAAKRFRP